MIAKICLVALLGCVLIRAEPKLSERKPIDHVGSAEPTPEEIAELRKEAQAYMDSAILDPPELPGNGRVIFDKELDPLYSTSDSYTLEHLFDDA